MYKRIYSSVIMLNYLKEKTYKGLPFELWDRYLWLYEPVLELLSKPVSDKCFDNVTLYTNEKGNEIKGIAYVERNGNMVNILLDTSTSDNLDELIQDLRGDNCSNIKIIVKRKEVAELVKKALLIDYSPGIAKFYAKECLVEPKYEIKEVKPGDGYLFKNEYLPQGWPEVDMYLAEGIRYFTIKEGDISISTCGLCYLSAFRAEVIAVGTREPFRNKGYAKSVCTFAMREAFQNVPIVTWTAKISNIASCAAAKSLGFIPYTELYLFEV